MPIPPDWPTWFGYMGIVNLICLVMAYGMQRIGYAGSSPAARRIWMLPGNGRIPLILLIAIFTCAAAFMIYLVQAGGFSGIAEEREDPAGALRGLGPLHILGGGLAPLLLIALTLKRGNLQSWRRASIIVIGIVLVSIATLQLATRGLTGSRASLVWFLV